MNTKTNRLEKGHMTYINGNVEMIDSQHFLVNGNRLVEDIGSDDFGKVLYCKCQDSEFRDEYCYHKIAVDFYLMGDI